MYSNFILSVNAVLPMAVLMLIGMLIKHRNWLNQAELKRLNGVIFKVFFFFMLFNSTYHATINDYRPRLLLYGIVVVLLLWIAVWIFSCAVTKDTRQRGAMIQNLYRSNFVIMGYPVVVDVVVGFVVVVVVVVDVVVGFVVVVVVVVDVVVGFVVV